VVKNIHIENKMPKIYQVYGLNIQSDFSLSGCSFVLEGQPDITIHQVGFEFFDSANAKNVLEGEWYICDFLEDGRIYLYWPEHFRFLVSNDGCEVFAENLSPENFESFNFYLLGPVVSYCLLKRGVESFHSSCVSKGDKTYAFLGDSGTGKSTLCAALLNQGWKLVTDDLLRLQADESKIMVYPGPLRVKLFSEQLRLLNKGFKVFSKLNQHVEKYIVDVSGACVDGPISLSAFVVLERAEVFTIDFQPVNGAECLEALLSNTYNTKWEHSKRLMNQLKIVKDLGDWIPVIKLIYPNDLNRLDEVVSFLEQRDLIG
jgi:hypothetical protein